LPDLRTSYKENLTKKGGYVIKEASADPKVTIMATGSEVGLAVEC
jgi:transketolase